MSINNTYIGPQSLTLGLHVYKKYLHWAPKSINMTYIGLFAALGLGFRTSGLAANGYGSGLGLRVWGPRFRGFLNTPPLLP